MTVAPRERSLWVLANGHGEDAIAAALATALAPRLAGWRLTALPIVGLGDAFARAGIALAEPRRRLPADGLTLHHPRLLLADVRAGLLPLTLAQVRALRRARADAVLVVGDVYAQALAALVPRAPRFVIQPLVSVRLAEGGAHVAWNRTFMERIRAPERALLRRAEVVYPRDEATAAYLRAHGVPRARFLGNPMMDGLQGAPLPGGVAGATLALLPGSRAYAARAVDRMLAALARLADDGATLRAWVAWTGGPLPAPPDGWAEVTNDPSEDVEGVAAAWRRGTVRVGWVLGRFADVLASADAVIGTSGTAQEQAAGLGLAVVAFPVEPEYGRPFLANQQRLLGPALEVVGPGPAAIAAAALRALSDPARRAAARQAGPKRLGPAGGTEAIAADVARRLMAGPGGDG